MIGPPLYHYAIWTSDSNFLLAQKKKIRASQRLALISGTGNCLGCLNECYMPLVAFYNSYTPTHANSSCQPLNKPLYWTYFVIYEILISYLLCGRISRFLFLYFYVLCLTDSVTHVRNSEIKQLRPLFFAIL